MHYPVAIGFQQGRDNAGVFVRNYFNSALIQDLRQQVFQGINEIETESKFYYEMLG